MSLHYWNTFTERSRLDRLMKLSQALMAEQAEEELWEDLEDDDDDVASVDSVNSSPSLDSLTSVDSMDSSLSLESLMSLDSMESDISTDSSFSFDSNHSIFASSTSDSDSSTVDFVVGETLRFAQYVYEPIIDMEIDFEAKPLLIADLDESKCLDYFRFRKPDLQDIADRLWPKLGMLLTGNKDKIRCANRYSCPYETGLLLCLYRLSQPNRLRDLESYFRMRKSRISAVILTFVDAMFKLALSYLSNPRIFQHRFEFYSRLIRNKAGLGILGVWGFIDGTLRKTCRPSRGQREFYSGHKRCHGIKLQSVVTPDGLIALLFGYIAGSRHDAFMLAQSGLIHDLRNIMPEGSPIFALYGDTAYTQSTYLLGGFRYAQPGSNEAQWNTKMSRVREAVEWLFKENVTQWAFLDFKNRMKILKFPVAKYYMVAAFLTNLRTCCYGSQTGIYFGCPEPGAEPDGGRLTLAEYLALVP